MGAGTKGVFSPRDRSRGLGCVCSRRLSALYLLTQGLEAQARSLGPLSASADVSAELVEVEEASPPHRRDQDRG